MQESYKMKNPMYGIFLFSGQRVEEIRIISNPQTLKSYCLLILEEGDESKGILHEEKGAMARNQLVPIEYRYEGMNPCVMVNPDYLDQLCVFKIEDERDIPLTPDLFGQLIDDEILLREIEKIGFPDNENNPDSLEDSYLLQSNLFVPFVSPIKGSLLPFPMPKAIQACISKSVKEDTNAKIAYWLLFENKLEAESLQRWILSQKGILGERLYLRVHGYNKIKSTENTSIAHLGSFYFTISSALQQRIVALLTKVNEDMGQQFANLVRLGNRKMPFLPPMFSSPFFSDLNKNDFPERCQVRLDERGGDGYVLYFPNLKDAKSAHVFMKLHMPDYQGKEDCVLKKKPEITITREVMSQLLSLEVIGQPRGMPIMRTLAELDQYFLFRELQKKISTAITSYKGGHLVSLFYRRDGTQYIQALERASDFETLKYALAQAMSGVSKRVKRCLRDVGIKESDYASAHTLSLPKLV